MAHKNPKSKPDENDLNKAISLASHGLETDFIENYIGLQNGLLEQHLKRSPKFKLAFTNAETDIILKIENALFKKASGYETTERHEICVPLSDEEKNDGNYIKGREEGYRVKEIRYVTKYIPCDGNAALIYLYNRKPDRWSKNPNSSENKMTFEEYMEDLERTAEQARNNI